MKGRTARKDGGSAYANGPESSNEKGVKVSDSDKGAKWYSGDKSNVKTEAEEPTGFKKGGKVSNFSKGKESEGMELFEKKKKSAKAEGDKAPHRLDRSKRASGGKVASGPRSPFSEAEKTSERPKFDGMKNVND
jgi:hypothetical protein